MKKRFYQRPIFLVFAWIVAAVAIINFVLNRLGYLSSLTVIIIDGCLLFCYLAVFIDMIYHKIKDKRLRKEQMKLLMTREEVYNYGEHNYPGRAWGPNVAGIFRKDYTTPYLSELIEKYARK